MEDKSNKQKVSAVIVTGGINNYLAACLDSLKAQTVAASEISVVDNSLSCEFSRKTASSYPQIKLYPQKENIFYCAALNLGIKASAGEFILCLNDDVILEKDFIKEALKGFFADTKVGMASGKILRQDRETIDTTGLFLSCWRTARERGYGAKDKGQFQKQEDVFGVNGAVAFYRKAMLEDIKEGNEYFDADFRIFYEDLDLAWRSRRRGWRCLYVPSAVAYHLRGGTVRVNRGIGKAYARRYLSESLHADLIKNRYLTIIKNESFFGLLLHLPCIAFYDILMWAYILFFKPGIIKVIFSDLKYLKSAFRKRLEKDNPPPLL